MTEIANLRFPCVRPGTNYDVEFDPTTKTIWGFFNPKETPCFSLGLLADIRAHDLALAENRGVVNVAGQFHEANYYVAASKVPGIYNLGGDLSLFMLLIKTRNRSALLNYGKLCIDNIFPRISNYFCPNLTTISLVQGDALGGGFETALASDVLIAEEGATMGLPEILFNLFPGMGAYNLLARRVGMNAAEKLILCGELFTARKLFEMGVVDVLAPNGEGERVTQEWIRKNAKRRNGFQAIQEAKKIIQPISRSDLDRIVELWVDAALRLEEKDIKMMHRLVRSQARRIQGNTDEPSVPDENLQRIAANG
ncbi:MAG: crotonase/enoyl-CoA hydratase family protein [Burkholderiales bacterium]